MDATVRTETGYVGEALLSLRVRPTKGVNQQHNGEISAFVHPKPVHRRRFQTESPRERDERMIPRSDNFQVARN